jgi:hypothetical protein
MASPDVLDELETGQLKPSPIEQSHEGEDRSGSQTQETESNINELSLHVCEIAAGVIVRKLTVLPEMH